MSAFAQNSVVDVVIDGKPAKMNTTTGVYTFTNGTPSSYNTSVKVSANVVDGSTHTVSRGETLYSIANKYGISMAQIKSLNKLKSNTLSVNQKLKIGYNEAAQIADKTTHIVKKGETLYSIAKNASITVEALKAINGLESNTISVGQTLKLK
ncbi:LysM peptidoglycan-binding domain-containing protein [Lacinutrix chionoecetis]